jgi:drug/metabolite transporter (DMT)-like permease
VDYRCGRWTFTAQRGCPARDCRPRVGNELAGDEDDRSRHIATMVDGAALRDRCYSPGATALDSGEFHHSQTRLHMVAFSALVAAGLQFVPAGRAIVLGYTTPIWVAIGARIFLSENITKRRTIGIGIGLAGLVVIFSSGVFDWSDHNALLGSSLIVIAAFCWAANIVYIKAHKWVSTPFQLVFWQVLLAAGVLSTIALFTDGAPHIEWSTRLAGLLLYSGIVCTALAHWAMTMVNRSLPAVTTSLGLLATPVLGIISAALVLNEPLEPSLFLAMALIIGGITLGTVADGRAVQATALAKP